VANSRSARKRIRSSERKRVRNRIVRSAVRTRIGRVRRSLVSGQVSGIEEELRAAVQALDKAAEKGILHRNNAARRKSRIMAMAAKLTLMSGSEAEQAVTRAVATGGAKGRTTRVAPASARSQTAEAPAAASKAVASKAAAGKAAKKEPTAKTGAAGKAAAAKKSAPAAPGTAPKPSGSGRRGKSES